jgi:phosphoglycerate kinase
MNYKLLSEYDKSALKDKSVIVRVDFNLPFDEDQIRDDTRVVRSLKTINYLRENGAKVIILSHRGRPHGIANKSFTLEGVAKYLAKKIDDDILFVPACVGEQVQVAVQNNQGIIVCENTRFYPEEEQNNLDFAKQLASLADLYVNDAFSVSHRAHATTQGITEFLPSLAGFLMEEELSALEMVLKSPQRPVMAIIGGAKVSSKLKVLYNLVEFVDNMIIAGGMANTFLEAKGFNTRDSLKEITLVDDAKSILEKAKTTGCNILLPQDAVVAQKLSATSAFHTQDVANIDHGMILDIGSKTIASWHQAIQKSNTILWNGPVGAFEISSFAGGTKAIANSVVSVTKNNNATSIVGGGDSIAALKACGCADDVSYISTAGGAFLEWLEGRVLPGVQALVA